MSRPKDCWGKEGKEKGKGGAHLTYTEGKGTRNDCHDSLPYFILRSHDICLKASGDELF